MRNSAIHLTSSKISVLRKFLTIFTPAALLVLFGLFLVYRYEIESHISLIKQKEINAVEMGEELIHNSISPVIEDLLFLTNITNKLLENYGENTVQQNVQLLEQNYLSFAGSHPLYDQIRLLDQHGWERIRVNYSGNGPILVAREELQDKHQRYYFEDAFRLDATQIFISPLDLNIEHGQIESPLKPMIRFGKVIVNPSGNKLGVVLLNYKAKAMLEALKHWGHRQDGGNLMLLNREGYWLAGKPEQEWGFMFSDRSTESLDQQEPELWASTIKSHEHGQVIHPNGIYTYATVHPLRGDFVSSTGAATATGDSKQILTSSDYYWKIVSLMSRDVIDRSLDSFRQQMLAVAAMATVVLALFAYLLAKAQVRRNQSALALKQSHDALEEQVANRTRQLQHQNEQLIEEINARRGSERALRESEDKYSTLLETMREGLVVIDSEGVITYCNARLGKMLEYSAEELFGHPLEEYLKEEDRGIFHQQLALRKRGLVPPYEITWQKKSGEMMLSSVSPALLRDKHGAAIGSFAVITDITAEREAELQKRTLENQLQQTQKMEALGTLAGGIAHDFNNILAAIIGYAELAADKVEPGSIVAKSINVILSAGDRAAQLVKQILAFSRQSNQDKQPLEIAPIVKETIKLIRAATSSSISIQLDLKQDVGQIMADPTQIHQIVMNLCTNACHAMALKGGQLRLAIERVHLNEQEALAFRVQSGDFIRFTISDTGSGISPEIQQRIFEPFFTTKEVGKGTGLGLSVVHSIVNDLSGNIHMESEVDRGTTFTIHLPISLQPSTKKAVISEKILYGNGEHLIWVDDEEPLVSMGCQMLSSLGYKTTGFTDPEQCLQAVLEYPDRYQLIISDYNMPKLNGLDLLEAIRSQKINIPFILCSGFSEGITPESAREKGLHQHLMKPVRKYDIALSVYQALRDTFSEQSA
ncbi:PAS domain S-box protein [Desulfobulbus rhabdoformis]|uniref:hybrid sensor histidine kinase/response regulator n=1 Tax=Desulfobulbus rhabdoformis TaxID=34032 RepID=UPI001963B7AB|nr:ATP-binding protein [Desulfobulbus rhabdoformis]MBM9612876.1 PAS domain S-box protein [Desulfobulbus rhabdoformis]